MPSSVGSPTSSQGAEDPEARRRRLRAQMREFYGAAAAPTTAASAAAAAAASAASPTPGGDTVPASVGSSSAGSPLPQQQPPHQQPALPTHMLDQPTFDVQKYISQLLRDESLHGLVEVDNLLLKSIRHLSLELQELVYVNYSKFVTATDAMTTMQSSIGDLSDRLTSLSADVESTMSVSRRLVEQMAPHHQAVTQTITAHRKLQKAKFVQQLPETLASLFKSGGDWQQATRCWLVGDSFFAEHCKESSSTATADAARRSASQQALRVLRQQCWDVVSAHYQHVVGKLTSLRMDDSSAVGTAHHYVEHLRLLRSTSLSAQLKKSKNGCKNDDDDGDDSFEDDMRGLLMKSVHHSFTTDLWAAIRGMDESWGLPSATAAPVNGASGSSSMTEPAILPPQEAPNAGGARSHPTPLSLLLPLDPAVMVLPLPSLREELEGLALEQRHQPVVQLSLEEPLALLKAAVALLVANSRQVRHILPPPAASPTSSRTRRPGAAAAVHNEEEEAATSQLNALLDVLRRLRLGAARWAATYARYCFVPAAVAGDANVNVGEEEEGQKERSSSPASTISTIDIPPLLLSIDQTLQSLMRVVRGAVSTFKGVESAETPFHALLSSSSASSAREWPVLEQVVLAEVLMVMVQVVDEVAVRSPTFKQQRHHPSLSQDFTPFCYIALLTHIHTHALALRREAAAAGGSSSAVTAVDRLVRFVVTTLREVSHRAVLQYGYATLVPLREAILAPSPLAGAAAANSDSDVISRNVLDIVVHQWGQFYGRLQALLSPHHSNGAATTAHTTTPGTGHVVLPVLLIDPAAQSVAGSGGSTGSLHHGRDASFDSFSPSTSARNIHNTTSNRPGMSPYQSTPTRLLAQPAGQQQHHHHQPQQQQQLSVSYLRGESSYMKMNIDTIFFHRSSLYETTPTSTSPAHLMRSVVLYVLRGLVDAMRRSRQSEFPSFQRIQAHSTLLLVLLLAPPSGAGTAVSNANARDPASAAASRGVKADAKPPLWLLSWSAEAVDDAMRRSVQREVDELCTTAFERLNEATLSLDGGDEEAVGSRKKASVVSPWSHTELSQYVNTTINAFYSAAAS